MPRKPIKASATPNKIIAAGGSVSIEAGASEGDKKGPAKFVSTFYTGGALNIEGWDLPVIIDLAGLEQGKTLVANLDHDRTKRVGNFALANDGKTLVASGTATAETPARDEVVKSALNGYEWQSSLEVNPVEVEQTKASAKFSVNGQDFEGAHYITRKGVLKGFAFVSHGADDNTTARIAAVAAPPKKKEQSMKISAEVKAWAEQILPSLDFDNLSTDEVANLTATFNGQNGKPAKKIEAAADPFEEAKLEVKRKTELRDIAAQAIERRNMFGGSLEDIEAIQKMHDHAVEAKMSPLQFRLELQEATAPQAYAPLSRRSTDNRITEDILAAAVCEAGGLQNLDKHFDPQVLDRARKEFRHGISLNELFIVAARANGHHDFSGTRVTIDVQRAAFPKNNPYRPQHATGFSTIDVANVVAATANKFLHEGWMAVDLTCLDIAAIKPVRDFKQTTTVSLTGALQFTKVGPAGEIKHGTLDDLTYTNQADTYAAMLAITRQDMINDDLGALTAVPRRLGRGGALKLNDIFWTEFLGLVSANFFASGNSNINTGVADMTLGGLEATETIFMNQTDPDGKPLGILPKIILVPTALKAKASALCNDQGSVLITGASSTIPAVNVFAGRFMVKSSPYISNSSYTGNTAVGWWMLADPRECAVIEIAALNGKVEPTVETADADFNVLGVQMRGYSDIGVNEQEKRGGVYADGGSS